MMLKINIPKNPALAVKMLIDSGFEAGVVGGCIRDALMNKIPHDWDICTSATPNEIQSVFHNFKQLAVGLKHGTVVIFINDEEIEITTYRIDGTYSDGRRPDTVSFTRNLVEDLSRRDYTQYAIFFNESVGIIDPFNGVSDIERKIIRCVGDANKRLREDALRILRGIRFASNLGFIVEESTKTAMLKNKELLINISQERIAVEFIKILQGKNAINILDEFQEIILCIIPEIKSMIGFEQNNPYHCYDVWKHTLITINNVDELILKLTMFFHDIGKINCYRIDTQGIGHFYGHADESTRIASEIFKRMKLTTSELISKNDIKNVIQLIKYHDIVIKPQKKSIRKILSKLDGNISQFQRLLSVKKADILAQNPDKALIRLGEIDSIQKIFNEVIEENICITLKKLAINGKDLIDIGIPAGEKIGKILNQLLEDVLAENLSNEKESLLIAAEKYNY